MEQIQYWILENHPADSRVKICDDGIFQTLSSRMGTGGGNVPMVLEVRTMQNTTGTLSPGAHAGSYNGQDAYNDMLVVDDGLLHRERTSESALPSDNSGCAELLGRSTKNSDRGGDIMNESVVRRLTPLECERLQGYPDGWTDIGEWTDTKGKQHKETDSPRYKALGNSIALPFWEWMAKRMVNQLAADGVEHPTMASLFDGIGGFPLVYSRAECEPIWASEIEEFPIAVTKIHFPEKEVTP